MEVRRSSSRHNTSSTVTSSTVAQRSNSKKHHTFKPAASILKKEELQNIDPKNVYDFTSHEAAKFIRGTSPTKAQFKKFVTLFYRGLYYSVNNLKGPSQEFIKKKSVTLPQPKNSKKKFLLLDLDETLIHSVFTSEKTDISFTLKGDEFKFNVRPYCHEFLQRMSQLYTIYVFTASTADYAEPIVEFLNEKNKTIHGVLNRKNCMETHNGFFIKDLRIIKNRGLKDLIIVDNLVHSFGLQIDNGIPILEYLKGKQDRQLLGIEKLLTDLAGVQDVREHIKEALGLRKVLEIHEDDFILVEDDRRHKTVKI